MFCLNACVFLCNHYTTLQLIALSNTRPHTFVDDKIEHVHPLLTLLLSLDVHLNREIKFIPHSCRITLYTGIKGTDLVWTEMAGVFLVKMAQFLHKTKHPQRETQNWTSYGFKRYFCSIHKSSFSLIVLFDNILIMEIRLCVI